MLIFKYIQYEIFIVILFFLHFGIGTVRRNGPRKYYPRHGPRKYHPRHGPMWYRYNIMRKAQRNGNFKRPHFSDYDAFLAHYGPNVYRMMHAHPRYEDPRAHYMEGAYHDEVRIVNDNRDVEYSAHANCTSEEFDCGDDNCIDARMTCDGVKNCGNGADECEDICGIKDVRCWYPPKMAHMTFTINYTIDTKDKKQLSSKVPEFVQVVVTCEPGYISDKGNSVVSKCWQGSWEPSFPRCLKPCDELNTINMQQECFFQNEQIDCNKVMMEGTYVHLLCQQPHHYPNHDRISCQSNGKWSISPEDIKCYESCGLYDSEVAEFMQHRDFPWRILIKETVNQSEHFFSGTLIHSRLVLTDRSGFHRSVNPDDFLMYVNDDITSWGPHKSYKVKNIHFNDNYNQELESPIGPSSLVIFETIDEIEFGFTVSPACIGHSHPMMPTIINKTGRIVTRGNTVCEQQNLHRDEIFILNVSCTSCINDKACSELMNHTNWYKPPDQFRGIIQGNKNLTDADRGTGLVKLNQRRKLYFLVGVYGVRYNSNITAFTFVPNYIKWIEDIRAKVTHDKPIQKYKPTRDKLHSNLLMVFVLLSFVILIAVFLRVK